MKRLRITYCIIILAVIASGIFVRVKQDWFPDVINLYLGDALYAVMMFYIYSFIIARTKVIYRAAYALATCYCIEFLQLSQAGFLVAARDMLPGRFILGHDFLWSDIKAYTVGIAVASCVDYILLHRKPDRSVSTNS